MNGIGYQHGWPSQNTFIHLDGLPLKCSERVQSCLPVAAYSDTSDGNISRAHLEESYIYGSEFSPSFYRRYVDDTFCIFRQPDHVAKFHDFLNSLNPSTKFDIEIEVDGKLSFLDTVVTKSSSARPDVSTKVKATDKGLFYDYTS